MSPPDDRHPTLPSHGIEGTITGVGRLESGETVLDLPFILWGRYLGKDGRRRVFKVSQLQIKIRSEEKKGKR